jgi:hypothetical protein
MCFDSRDTTVAGVKVRGGHDALHTQRCERFRVHDCDFRTGDDAFAGCDNADFDIRNCQVNSSCNAFRLGCEKLVVKDCRLWGPGEYEHKISGRTNMLGAFVHFAPRDRHPQRPSDDWLIENVTVDQAEALYLYDFERGGWMQGQPAGRLQFRNIRATRLTRPTRAVGDAGRKFQLTLEKRLPGASRGSPRPTSTRRRPVRHPDTSHRAAGQQRHPTGPAGQARPPASDRRT